MSDVKSYCWSLIIISVTVGVCLLLSPGEKASGKHLRFAGALCITAYLLSPLTRITDLDFTGTFNMDFDVIENESTDNADSLIVSEAERLIEDDVKEYVNNEYNVTCIQCDAHFTLGGNNDVTLDQIYLKVNVKSEFLIREIKRDISDKYECDVYVSGKGKE